MAPTLTVPIHLTPGGRARTIRQGLTDSFGRIATDLRISVTDRCNLRCTYCMPAEGLTWLDRDDLLTFSEITRLTRVFMSLGITSIRITGGEPLVRPGIEKLVGELSDLGIEDLSLTTNGVGLSRHAEALAAAGLKRINVSVDSLLEHRFTAMTRRDELARVLGGLKAAERAGLSPIKLNCVVVRGTNDDELLDFARFSRETGYEVRFIEYMPLDADRRWRQDDVVGSAEVLDVINSQFPMVPAEMTLDPAADPASADPASADPATANGHSEPATRYVFSDGAPGAVGVISSVTEPFCTKCDRLRLTADGQLRTCLFALDETDLRSMLRADASDGDLAIAITDAVAGKWAGHHIGRADFVRPARSMSAIGG